jgi:hypothetical protein
MNRKEATLIAIVGMAIFATVMATSSSTQALASVDDTSNNGVASDGIDSSGTTDNTNEDENDEDITTESTNNDGEETSSDGNADDKDSSRVADDDLQACLSDNEGEGSPTEQDVQDCMDPNYKWADDNGTPSESTNNGDEDNNSDEDEIGNTEDDDNGDSEVKEEDEWE